jgi:hypothetical protein
MNAMSKPFPSLEDLPPESKFKQPAHIAGRGLNFASTVDNGLWVMFDLITVMRREIAAEDKRCEENTELSPKIEIATVEALCDKLEFVIDSLQQTRDFYSGYFMRLGGGDDA